MVDIQANKARAVRPRARSSAPAIRLPRWTRKAMVTASLVLIAIVMCFPVYWMVVSSLKGPGELFLRTPTFLPKAPLWENYSDVFVVLNYFQYMINSLIVSLTTTFLSVLIGCVSGYSFARFKYRGRKTTVFILLVSQMFPAALLVIPMFLILNQLGLLNTHVGLILAYTAFILPFCVWMMKGFYSTIPVDLEEQAMIDGATRLQALWYIVVPLAAPGAASTAAFAFVASWNEFLFALNLTTNDSVRTLPVGLSLLLSPYFNNWGVLMTGGVLTSIPTVLMFLMLQRFLTRGLTAGAVK